MLKPTPTKNINEPAKGDLGPSKLSKQKKERREKWAYLRTRARVYVFCIVGAIAHRGLDLAGEAIDLAALSLNYVGFAVAISIPLTLWLERREIPADLPRIKAIKILRRMGFNAFLLDFGLLAGPDTPVIASTGDDSFIVRWTLDKAGRDTVLTEG